jgi:hypothetical protein
MDNKIRATDRPGRTEIFIVCNQDVRRFNRLPLEREKIQRHHRRRTLAQLMHIKFNSFFNRVNILRFGPNPADAR